MSPFFTLCLHTTCLKSKSTKSSKLGCPSNPRGTTEGSTLQFPPPHVFQKFLLNSKEKFAPTCASEAFLKPALPCKAQPIPFDCHRACWNPHVGTAESQQQCWGWPLEWHAHRETASTALTLQLRGENTPRSKDWSFRPSFDACSSQNNICASGTMMLYQAHTDNLTTRNNFIFTLSGKNNC